MAAMRHTQDQRSDRPGARRHGLPLGAFAAGRLGGDHLCLWLGVLALLVVSIGTMAHPRPTDGAMSMAFDCGAEHSSVPDHRDCIGGDSKVHMTISGMCTVVSCASVAAVLPTVKMIRPLSSVPLFPVPEHEHTGVDPDPDFPPPKSCLPT